jgi:hydrogenase maturation protease
MGTVLVLGLGNRLLGDDAAGPLVIDRLGADESVGGEVALQDGGTIGLGLLPAVEDASALIVIDATRLGAAPGNVRVLEGAAMDRQAGSCRGSVHEVALADLLGAAALRGRLPARRALVAVEPQHAALGEPPSPPVAAAIPAMCAEVRALLQRWAA